MEPKQIEIVGKVFVVVGARRRCLVCGESFTPTEAANHATAPCHTRDAGRKTLPMT